MNRRERRGTERGVLRLPFVHPVLAVDAETGHALGLLDVQVWRRFKGKAADYRKLPIEDKESYRWLKGPQRIEAALPKAAMITVIDDREGDICEKSARLPDRRTRLLIRACRVARLSAVALCLRRWRDLKRNTASGSICRRDLASAMRGSRP